MPVGPSKEEQAVVAAPTNIEEAKELKADIKA